MTGHESTGVSEDVPQNVVVTTSLQSIDDGHGKNPRDDDFLETDDGVDTPDRRHQDETKDFNETNRNVSEDSVIKKLKRKRKSESWWSVLSIIIIFSSMVFYFLDVVSDSYVIYLLSEESSNWWLALTLTFVIVPTIIINCFSLMWYLDDKKSLSLKHPPLSKSDKIIRYGSHCLGLGPVVRYFEAIIFAANSRRQQMRSRKRQIEQLRNIDMEFKEDKYNFEKLSRSADRDASMLSLIKSFSESAPQLILQIYILVIRGHFITTPKGSAKADAWQAFSITISLLSFAWGIASYQRALRFCVKNANTLGRSGQAAMFFWRLGMIMSRVFALALFASHFKYWIVPIIFGHWGVMTIWIIHQNTSFCVTESGKPVYWKEYLYDIIMGIVYIFCYFNVINEKTFRKYTAYYILVFLENCTCISLWYHYSDSSVWYYRPAIALVFLSFILGLMMMLLYYGFLHPNGPRIDIQKLIKIGSLKKTGDSDTNEKSAERQSLFGVCCSNSQNISQNSDGNTTPLEPKGDTPAIYTIEDDAIIDTSETGL